MLSFNDSVFSFKQPISSWTPSVMHLKLVSYISLGKLIVSSIVQQLHKPTVGLLYKRIESIFSQLGVLPIHTSSPLVLLTRLLLHELFLNQLCNNCLWSFKYLFSLIVTLHNTIYMWYEFNSSKTVVSMVCGLSRIVLLLIS